MVTNQLAKVNDYNAASVNRLVDRIKQLGVSTQEAHGVVQRMIFAELELSKATDLARVARDAAVVSGVNSSEARNPASKRRSADWKSPAGLATIERDDKGFRLVFAKKQKTEAERRAEEEARDAAKERARKQAEFALQLEDEAVASRKSGLTGYARDVAEMNTRIKKGTTYFDKNGIEQVAPLTQAAWQSVLEIMRNKVAACKEELHKNTAEYFRDYIKEMEEADNRRRELEGKQFQERGSPIIHGSPRQIWRTSRRCTPSRSGVRDSFAMPNSGLSKPATRRRSNRK